MKTTLTTTQAAHLLLDDNNANWSRAGAYALIEYLEELENDTGEEMELCPCTIRCNFSEYDSLVDWADDYFCTAGAMLDALRLEPEDHEDEIEEAIREYIRDHGTLIEFDGRIIVSAF